MGMERRVSRRVASNGTRAGENSKGAPASLRGLESCLHQVVTVQHVAVEQLTVRRVEVPVGSTAE